MECDICDFGPRPRARHKGNISHISEGQVVFSWQNCLKTHANLRCRSHNFMLKLPAFVSKLFLRKQVKVEDHKNRPSGFYSTTP